MNFQNKTLLITGTDDYFSLRVTELAQAQGMKVRELKHSQERAKKSQNPAAEVIVGSVTDPATAEQACQGVDIVLHTADVSQESGSLQQFREVNVGGTVNMAKAAQKAGVKTFVQLSSALVYGFNYPNRIAEDGPLGGDNPYCQTKIEAEKELLKLNAPPEFGVIIIRAGDVYFPGCIPWIVRPLLLMRQKLFVLANGGQGVMNHVYADNLIEAIFLAAEKEAYGEIFNITDGQETSWKEYFTRLAEIGGVSMPISMPAGLLKAAIQQHRFAQRLIGKKPDILPESVDFVTRPHAYSIAKAQSMLGYQPKISLEEGMGRIQDWLKTTDLQKLTQA